MRTSFCGLSKLGDFQSWFFPGIFCKYPPEKIKQHIIDNFCDNKFIGLKISFKGG